MVNSRAGGFATEQSSTPITDDTESGLTVNNRFYGAAITLPTTYEYYIITAIEWKNGTAVLGTVTAGVSVVDADPPVAVMTYDLAHTPDTTTAGTSAVQRAEVQHSDLIKGGSLIAPWITASESTTGKFRYDVVGSQNQQKGFASYVTARKIQSDYTAWTTNTCDFYLKIYYRGVN